MRTGIATTLLLLLVVQAAFAQKQLVSTVDFDSELVYYRPRIAMSAEGAYAVSWEALRKMEDAEEWQIGVQRFGADSERLADKLYLSKSVVCSAQSIDDFNALPDEMEDGLRNVEMDFSSDGLLVLSMEQFRLFREADTRAHKQISSVRVSLMDQGGEEFQPASDEPCVWRSHNSIEDAHNTMPRFDLSMVDNTFFGTDGRQLNVMPTMYIDPDAWRYKVNQTSTTQAGKRQIRNWADVASNGWFNVSSWQRCSVQDEGLDPTTYSKLEEDCDIEIQFFTDLSDVNTDRALRKLVVNQDDTAGVLNYRPAVAMNASGHSVVVWVDFREGEAGDIYGQRFDDLGRPVGDNFKISAGNGAIDAEAGSRPEVAMLDNGKFLVVWTEHHDDGMRAWGRYFSHAGQPEATPFLLDPDPSLDSGFPDVTSNGKRFAYTWLVDHDKVTSIFANVPGVTNIIERTTSFEKRELLLKGYPNPFTSETTLEYSLKERGHVTLVIYDLLGREVKRLIDQPQGPGSYSIKLDAEELASGYYMTRLQQGDQTESHLLVRTE
ncbi:MAG: T9SS type A sorting domain-containing protein [Bacteroidota bacterium]